MPNSEEIPKRYDLDSTFLGGERILGIKFRHNSHVRFPLHGGQRAEGWIVGVRPIRPEPIYTIERADGGGDEEVLESKIELISDPHEPTKS